MFAKLGTLPEVVLAQLSMNIFIMLHVPGFLSLTERDFVCLAAGTYDNLTSSDSEDDQYCLF